MKKSSQQFHSGFTLIETLFSILIFSAALISLMAIAARGISATADASQETTASYLAQEGIEVARNIRDSNYGVGAPFDTTLSSCTITAPCDLLYGSPSNPNVPTLVPCGATINMIGSGTTDLTCPAIKQSQTTGWYADQGTPSEFFRTIYVIPAPLPLNSTNTTTNEYQVISRVNWVSKTIPHVVSLDTILRDWH